MTAIVPLLVFVMHVNGSPVMSVQAMPVAGMCQKYATTVRQHPDVVAATCTRSAEFIDKAAERGECEPVQVTDNFVNYICRKTPTWK